MDCFVEAVRADRAKPDSVGENEVGPRSASPASAASAMSGRNPSHRHQGNLGRASRDHRRRDEHDPGGELDGFDRVAERGRMGDDGAIEEVPIPRR